MTVTGTAPDADPEVVELFDTADTLFNVGSQASYNLNIDVSTPPETDFLPMTLAVPDALVASLSPSETVVAFVTVTQIDVDGNISSDFTALDSTYNSATQEVSLNLPGNSFSNTTPGVPAGQFRAIVKLASSPAAVARRQLHANEIEHVHHECLAAQIGCPLGGVELCTTNLLREFFFEPRCIFAGGRGVNLGLDFRWSAGNNVYAAEAGIVVLIGRLSFYRRLIAIWHPEPYTFTLYARLGDFSVGFLDTVERGEVIGTSSGILHFEYIPGRRVRGALFGRIDPEPCIGSFPTSLPSEVPSGSPSTLTLPSSEPSYSPSDLLPSSTPSDAPSFAPSTAPSSLPSATPSDMPSDEPSEAPSSRPSDLIPSSTPSDEPSTEPSVQPSDVPSSEPSEQPSGLPSSEPSGRPSASDDCVDDDSRFNICLSLSSAAAADTTYAQFVQQGLARWTDTIQNDIASQTNTISASSIFNACGFTPSFPDTNIDDIDCCVDKRNIDGVGRVRWAGHFFRTVGTSFSPINFGFLNLDAADVPNMIANDQILDVMIHEFGTYGDASIFFICFRKPHQIWIFFSNNF